MSTSDLEIKLASLTQTLSNIDQKIGKLEENDEKILKRIEDLSGGKVAELDKDIVLLKEKISVLQKIIYGLVGAVLLAVASAVINLVL